MREALRGEGCGCQVPNGLQLQLPGRVGARGWPRVPVCPRSLSTLSCVKHPPRQPEGPPQVWLGDPGRSAQGRKGPEAQLRPRASHPLSAAASLRPRPVLRDAVHTGTALPQGRHQVSGASQVLRRSPIIPGSASRAFRAA